MNKKEFFLREENSKNLIRENKTKNAKKPICLKEAFKIFSPQLKNNISTTNTFCLKTEKLTSEENLNKNFLSFLSRGPRQGLAPMQESNVVKKADVQIPDELRRTMSMRKIEYKLETFQRSNQDTCLTHKPAVFEGDWVQSGDYLTDCANSVGGELSLGQNIFIAYMPWEGYNFEDAILISERLVSDDVFTSVHIERYEIENIQKNEITQQERLTNKEIKEKTKNQSKTRKGNKAEGLSTSGLSASERRTTKTAQTSPTKKGKTQLSIPQTRTTHSEEITRDIPDVSPEEIAHLDSFGIVKIGSFIEEGDILVGKITPINKKEFTPYQKLLYTILDKQIRPFRDSSLRAPKGIKAKVIDIKIFVKPGSVVRSPLTISPYGGRVSRNAAAHVRTTDDLLTKTKENFLRKKFTDPSLKLPRNFIKSYSKPSRGQVGFSSLIKKNKKTIKKLKKKFYPNNFLRNRIFKSPKLSQQKRKTMRSPYGFRKIFYKKNLENFSPKFFTQGPLYKIFSNEKNFISTSRKFFSLEKNFLAFQFAKRTTFGTGAFTSPVSNLTKSFLITKKTRNILLQGLRPQHSLYSIVGEDVQKKIPTGKKFISTSNLPKAYLKKLKTENKNRNENSFCHSRISQISSYSSKFSKSSRVIRTLDSIVNGQYKNQKIMKQLKKELNKNYNISGENLINRNRNFIKTNSPVFSKEKNPFYSTKSIKDIETIHIYLAEKRKIQVGDKMSGRHGNKGIVSQILPIQDMPFLPDGTPIDMVLNPLGVPSRMNVGQIYECLLGLAGKYLGENYRISSFDEIYGPEASRSFVFNKLYEARRKTGFKWLFNPQYPGKIRLYDGRTGDCYHQPVTVGQAYMLRLVHMVDDKIHMRSTGPYSLVTQQPLRGRSKQGGQRLGEMEVWALEGYGAAFTLLEMLTVKSDDLTGRMTLWSNLILNKDLTIGTPEAFKVLICELQALCLDIGLFRYNTVTWKENFFNEKKFSKARQGFAPNSINSSLRYDSEKIHDNPFDSYSEKSNILKGPHQKKSLTEITSLMSFP